MKGSLEIWRSGRTWLLGLVILGVALFLRIQALSDEIGKVLASGAGPDPSQVLMAELDALRPNLPERGQLSLLLKGQDEARKIRPLIETWSQSIAEFYISGKLPSDPAQALLVKSHAETLRPHLPGIPQGELPGPQAIADLLEKVLFATLDSASHTLAQYALAPLILEPALLGDLRPGLVLARLPKGRARAEARRLGLRWKKVAGPGWFLLEKRP
jgi:hypothetical protein